MRERRKKSQKKIRGRKVANLDYFLLMRGIEFLGASLIFIIRISNFFLLYT